MQEMPSVHTHIHKHAHGKVSYGATTLRLAAPERGGAPRDRARRLGINGQPFLSLVERTVIGARRSSEEEVAAAAAAHGLIPPSLSSPS